MDEETGEIEWTGCARVDPAAVFVVGEIAVTAAELARWVQRHKEWESDWKPSWRFDLAMLSVCVVGCVSIVYLAGVR